MAKTEKIAYILEQVRLCLDKEDFARAQVGKALAGQAQACLGQGRDVRPAA